MNRKSVRLQLTSFLLLLITLCLFAARPVHATSTSWARWLLDITFPDNKLDTQLIIQVGHTTSSGKKVVDAQQSFAVNCQTVGNPLIQNEEATFDGSSYFQCAVPSIQQKVRQMPGHLTIPSTCDSKQPFVAGVLTVEDNPVQWNPDNPIFHRDDIQFATPFNSTTQQAQITVTFNQASAESSSFTPSSTTNSVLAIYNKTGQTSYAPAFTVDGNSLTATPAALNGAIPLSTLESTVYVGYSPVSGKYFEGSFSTLLVDPVCIGQG